MSFSRTITLTTALLLGTASAALAAPNVVATIKPVHSLVAAVMEGVGEPTLLVKGAASPHTYSLKPSDAAALESADIVFWTGHGMELFLDAALDSLSTKAEIVELAETPGLITYPVREGGAFEAHDHGEGEDHDHAEGEEHDHDHEHEHEHEEGEEHHHDEGAFDMHFWLDPVNAEAMVTYIAETLSAADPENAETYAANAGKEKAALEALTEEVQASLTPIADKPFVVFHDAFQYFEKRFGLTIAGSVTVTPDVMPGVQRIGELKAKVAELGATCVFAEPQFEPAIISAITEGSGAKSGVLDPEASALTEGVELYPELLKSLAASLVDCLEK